MVVIKDSRVHKTYALELPRYFKE